MYKNHFNLTVKLLLNKHMKPSKNLWRIYLGFIIIKYKLLIVHLFSILKVALLFHWYSLCLFVLGFFFCK